MHSDDRDDTSGTEREKIVCPRTRPFAPTSAPGPRSAPTRVAETPRGERCAPDVRVFSIDLDG